MTVESLLPPSFPQSFRGSIEELRPIRLGETYANPGDTGMDPEEQLNIPGAQGNKIAKPYGFPEGTRTYST